VTPGATTNLAAATVTEANIGRIPTTPSANATGSGPQSPGVGAVSSPTYGNNLPVSNSQASTGDLFGSIFLAVLGVGSFYLFLKYQHWLYFWLGLERRPLAKVKKQRANGAKEIKELGHGTKSTQTTQKGIVGDNQVKQGEEKEKL
jgi:hypothetical protein